MVELICLEVVSCWVYFCWFHFHLVGPVREHQANSHAKKGWEQFTDAVIKTISLKKSGIVFILWGNSAQAKTRYCFVHICKSVTWNVGAIKRIFCKTGYYNVSWETRVPACCFADWLMKQNTTFWNPLIHQGCLQAEVSLDAGLFSCQIKWTFFICFCELKNKTRLYIGVKHHRRESWYISVT